MQKALGVVSPDPKHIILYLEDFAAETQQFQFAVSPDGVTFRHLPALCLPPFRLP